MISSGYAVVAWVLLCLTTTNTLAADSVRLTTGHWPPYLEADSADGGFAAQIILEAFATQGIAVDFDYLPWSRALMLADTTGYHGTAIWSCTPERKKNFLFSNPILPFRLVFYHRATDNLDWQTLHDLEGKTVGLTQDYAYGRALTKAARSGIVKTDMTTSDHANFLKLAAGRIDLFPMDPVVGAYIIKNELPLAAAGIITFDPTPVRKAAYHVMFNENNPEAESLRQRFNDGLAALKATGRLAELLPEALPIPETAAGRTSTISDGRPCLAARF